MAQAAMAKGLAVNPALLSYHSGGSPKPSPVPSSLRVGMTAKHGHSGSLMAENNSSKWNQLRVSASVAVAAGKTSAASEIVLQPIKEISGTVKLPGSKSLSNRILLLAALSEVS